MDFDLKKCEIDALDFKSDTEILLFEVFSEITNIVIDSVANDFFNASINKKRYISIDKNKLILSLKNSDELNNNIAELKSSLSEITEKDIYNAAVSLGMLTAFNMVNSSFKVMKEGGGSVRKLISNL